MAWIAAVAALAAAALSSYNTRKTAKKADAAAARGIANQRKQSERGHSAIQGALAKLEASRAANAKAESGKRYLAALGRAGVGGAVTGAQRPNASAAFQSAADEAAANEGSYARNLAGMYGNMDGATDQRMSEAFEIGNLGTDLGTVSSIANGQAGLDNLKVGAASRRNPWLDLTAQALQGYASGRSSAGGG